VIIDGNKGVVCRFTASFVPQGVPQMDYPL